MISVIFVCLGNICRSPMAELIFKKMVEERGLSSSFSITSFGTSNEEEGNQLYPPAKQTLEMHGVYGNHRAKQLTLQDVINADYILVMDSSNLMDIMHLTCGKFGEKVFKLCSFTSCPRDVADPWYTRDFERAYYDIYDGCKCFLDFLACKNAKGFEYDKR